tara:strand:- start:267 stop:770 length:504 start_codon:yes stop_codon:yes gene_type:complete
MPLKLLPNKTALSKLNKADLIAHCWRCYEEIDDWRKVCPDINEPGHMEFFWEEMEGKVKEKDVLEAQKVVLEAEMTSISKTLAEMGCKQNPDTPEHKHLPTIAEAVKIILKDLKEENEKFKEEIEKLNKMKSIKWSREFACPEIQRLKEENEKLKEIISLELGEEID